MIILMVQDIIDYRTIFSSAKNAENKTRKTVFQNITFRVFVIRYSRQVSAYLLIFAIYIILCRCFYGVSISYTNE